MVIINFPEWVWFFLFGISIAHVVISFINIIVTIRHSSILKKTKIVAKEVSDVIEQNTKLKKDLIDIAERIKGRQIK